MEHQKSQVDLAIERFASKENPTIADLNEVIVAGQVDSGVQKYLNYRIDAQGMSKQALKEEQHDSDRLGKHMTAMGDPRPADLCHAHAIVSGAHPGAAALRAILAHFKLRIDDPDNGCWLPKNTDAKKYMPTRLRNAVPHSRIHRANYYTWMSRIIDLSRIKSVTKLRFELNMIEKYLQEGTHPEWVMNRKDEGVPS